MKYFIKNVHLILFFLTILLIETEAYTKNNKIEYSKKIISNYFTGIISANKDNAKTTFKYLNKIQLMKKNHDNYSVQFIRTLVLLEKFDQAIAFSKSIWFEDESFFEVDLLLGLDSFIKEDYENAGKLFT